MRLQAGLAGGFNYKIKKNDTSVKLILLSHSAAKIALRAFKVKRSPK